MLSNSSPLKPSVNNRWKGTKGNNHHLPIRMTRLAEISPSSFSSQAVSFGTEPLPNNIQAPIFLQHPWLLFITDKGSRVCLYQLYDKGSRCRFVMDFSIPPSDAPVLHAEMSPKLIPGNRYCLILHCRNVLCCWLLWGTDDDDDGSTFTSTNTTTTSYNISHEYQPLSCSGWNPLTTLTLFLVKPSDKIQVLLIEDEGGMVELTMGEDTVISVETLPPVITKKPIKLAQIVQINNDYYIVLFDEDFNLIVMDAAYRTVFVHKFLVNCISICFDHCTRKISLLLDNGYIEFIQVLRHGKDVKFFHDSGSEIFIEQSKDSVILGLAPNPATKGSFLVFNDKIFYLDIATSALQPLHEYPVINRFTSSDDSGGIFLIHDIVQPITVSWLCPQERVLEPSCVADRLKSLSIATVHSENSSAIATALPSLSTLYPPPVTRDPKGPVPKAAKPVKSSGYGKETRMFFTPFQNKKKGTAVTGAVGSKVMGAAKNDDKASVFQVHDSSVISIQSWKEDSWISVGLDGSLVLTKLAVGNHHQKSKVIVNSNDKPIVSMRVQAPHLLFVTSFGSLNLMKLPGDQGKKIAGVKKTESQFKQIVPDHQLQPSSSHQYERGNGHLHQYWKALDANDSRFVFASCEDILDLYRVESPVLHRIYRKRMPEDLGTINCIYRASHDGSNCIENVIVLGHRNGSVSLFRLDGRVERTWKLVHDDDDAAAILDFHEIHGCQVARTTHGLYQIDYRSKRSPWLSHKLPVSTLLFDSQGCSYGVSDGQGIKLYDYRYRGRMVDWIKLDRLRVKQASCITSFKIFSMHQIVIGFDSGQIGSFPIHHE